MEPYKSKNKCYGCSACAINCPKQAISMQADEEGFLYPFISENCIGCNLCIKICNKNIFRDEVFERKAYAFVNKDKDMRRSSSSGGIFILLAQTILQSGGMVCGAIVEQKTLKVKHIISNNFDDVRKMMGSKYVQSDMVDCYSKIKYYLDKGLPVLFTGTPCQVEGCYKIAGHHNKLITCDVLCHGAPSPMIWQEYLNDLVLSNGSAIEVITFRSKKRGWHNFGMEIFFSNKKRYYKPLDQDAFLRGFLKDLYLRPSCYTCKYSRIERISDITIGDFWGYKNSFSENIKDDDKGLSAVIVNTTKGMEILSSISPYAYLHQVDISSMISGNAPLRKPVSYPLDRDLFWNDYTQNGYNYVKSKYMFGVKYSCFEKFKRSTTGRMLVKIKNIFRR